MNMRFLTLALAVLGAAFVVPTQAQNANRNMSLIVPFSPGGGTDILSRTVAPVLGTKLDLVVNVENKPGAAGALAAQFVARAAPDGRTLMVGSTSEIGINPSLYPKLPYNVTRDFVAVAPLASTPMVLVVNPASPIKTAKDLVTRAQQNPGGISFASAGIGSGAHLAAELFFYETKIKLTHIPYKGVGPALADIIGSQKDMILFTTLPSATSFAKAGQLRIVAVSSKDRAPTMPEVPTFLESGVPGYVMDYWYGLVAPIATPPDVLQRIQAAVADVMRQPAIGEALLKQGLQPTLTTPEQFATFIRADMERWATVVKAANITAEQ